MNFLVFLFCDNKLLWMLESQILFGIKVKNGKQGKFSALKCIHIHESKLRYQCGHYQK